MVFYGGICEVLLKMIRLKGLEFVVRYCVMESGFINKIGVSLVSVVGILLMSLCSGLWVFFFVILWCRKFYFEFCVILFWVGSFL